MKKTYICPSMSVMDTYTDQLMKATSIQNALDDVQTDIQEDSSEVFEAGAKELIWGYDENWD